MSIIFNIPGVHSLGINGFLCSFFCECTLHTLDLGVAQRFCATAMVCALKANMYGLPFKAKRKLVIRGSLTLAKDIKQYYKDERAKNRWNRLSTLSKTFSWRDLGKFSKPCLRAKDGQTRGLVKFCTELVKKVDCGKQGKLLALSGQSLLDCYEVMDEEPRRMTLLGREKLISSMVNHVVLYKAAGGHLVYKHHGAIHMVLLAGFQGNPKSVSTYEDEHENGVVAKIGVRVHGASFSKSVFERLELQNPERRMLPILSN